MGKETLILVVVSIIIFLVLLGFLKSIIKVGIFVMVIVLIFKIGWGYTSDDLKNKLHLDTFISEEYQEGFFNKYDNYTERRKENEIIDTDEINNSIDTHLEKLDKKVDEYIGKN